MTSKKKLKFGIFILAYNVSDTIVEAYQRIPSRIKDEAEEIFVFEDRSRDETYEKILSYKKKHRLRKLKVYRNEKNLGYGGNQKRGYDYAIKKGFDLVAMLHGDVQYAPERIGDLIDTFRVQDSDLGLVFGSRMRGSPLKGGMPFYKYLGNKGLTLIQNFFLKTNLSEFHSGYRCYSCPILSQIPYHLCSDGFSFDTEIIIMLLQRGYKIEEVVIPTFYGKEKSHLRVVGYGLNCLRAVFEFKMSQIGLAEFEKYSLLTPPERNKVYRHKTSPYSSHSKIEDYLTKTSKPEKVLDVGCGAGFIRPSPNFKVKIVGIDKNPPLKPKSYSKIVRVEIGDFKSVGKANLEKFDLIIMAGILEKLVNPEDVFTFYAKFLNKNGEIIISVFNFANIFIRLPLLFGRFNYSNKGILDKTHLRFFTLNSINNLIEKSEFITKEIMVTPVPFEMIIPGLLRFRKMNFFLKMMDWFANKWRSLFAFQFILIVGKKKT